jgi:hypothetical protein
LPDSGVLDLPDLPDLPGALDLIFFAASIRPFLYTALILLKSRVL